MGTCFRTDEQDMEIFYTRTEGARYGLHTRDARAIWV